MQDYSRGAFDCYVRKDIGLDMWFRKWQFLLTLFTEIFFAYANLYSYIILKTKQDRYVHRFFSLHLSNICWVDQGNLIHRVG